MIVDISGNIFEIEPQKKKENNFINKILNIIPFQEVGNKYVAPLEWIYIKYFVYYGIYSWSAC